MIAPEMFDERRQELRQQLGAAQSRLLAVRAQQERANNDVEAIYGALQELDEWERRFHEGENNVPQSVARRMTAGAGK